MIYQAKRKWNKKNVLEYKYRIKKKFLLNIL